MKLFFATVASKEQCFVIQRQLYILTFLFAIASNAAPARCKYASNAAEIP